jgi:hypothetical protein
MVSLMFVKRFAFLIVCALLATMRLDTHRPSHIIDRTG